jgi:hypothetical protein
LATRVYNLPGDATEMTWQNTRETTATGGCVTVVEDMKEKKK